MHMYVVKLSYDISHKGMASLIEKDQLRPIYEKYHFLEQMPATPPQ
jgi:hypothetical protein